MKTRSVLALLIPVLTLAVTPRPGAAQFGGGDLYLLSRQLPTIVNGILRIDPLTGATSVLVDLPDTEPALPTFSYDAYRDRLLFLDTATIGVRTVDASGAVATLATGADRPALIAARGDGIIYLWFEPSIGFFYLDASDVMHPLLDASGTATFTFPSGTQIQEMIYDPGTNSLLCLSGTSSNPIAPCALAGQTCAVRVPLTTSGTQVAGAPLSAQVDVSTSLERIGGASLVPGGSVLVIVDTNDNLQSPRMQALDTGTMTFSTFASNGPYTGAAATDAGTWSTVQGRALILDTLNDVLRSFGSGEVGNGTVFATGVSGSGSGEPARLVQVVKTTTAAPPVATSLELRAPSPNPFRGATTIRFGLSSPAHVKLTLHDLSGRLVRDLIDESRPAGMQAVTWDGSDAWGRQLPAGVYLAVLRAGESVWSARIVLLN